MVDACEVSRWDGATYDFNESTGVDEPAFVVQFSSVCKVQARELQSAEVDAGGTERTLLRLTVHLPVSAPVVATDDRLTVTASRDAQLVGRVFRVLAPVGKSIATARRIEVEGVVA